MTINEKTLEETIASAQSSIDVTKERNLDNIQKITERIVMATGDEKIRLEGLLELHNTYKVELQSRDAISEGTERFNQLKSRLGTASVTDVI